MTIHPHVALNPLPWILDSRTGFHLDLESLTAAFGEAAPIGFQAVQADVPSSMGLDSYRELLARFGLSSGPGYFGGDFEDETALAQILESARKHARIQRELGLTEVFIAGNISNERRAVPAVGHDFDADRLSVVIRQLEATAAVFREEGLMPALHPHVGSWIETEAEVQSVLDAISSDILAFGPDVGHLTWAGMDAAAVMAGYRERIVAVHLKDVDKAAAAAAISSNANYSRAVDELHVWTEPGRGSVDFDAVFEALPDPFEGWAVFEVDVPNLPSAVESTEACAAWARSRPELKSRLAPVNR